MTLLKKNALIDKSVEIRRVHVFETERADRIVALLVRDNKDDIGTRVRHAESLSEAKSKMETANIADSSQLDNDATSKP